MSSEIVGSVYRDVEKNIDFLNKKMGADVSVDVVVREFEIGSREAAMVFIDGFMKDELIWVLDRLMSTTREEISLKPLEKVISKKLPYFEVMTVEKQEEVMTWILSGPQALFIQGEEEAIIIDGRDWLTRTPEEPETEKITRGAADGFVETYTFNIAAIRRRIRDPNFRAEHFQVGRRSKTDVAVTYIKDITNPDLVQTVKDRIEKIDVDGLPNADTTIKTFLTGGSKNPLPKVRFTERPDVAASHLYEGHVVVITDNSPAALILPGTFFLHTQSMEEHRKTMIVGSYLSLVRLTAIFLSFLLPGLWLSLALRPEILPEALAFIGPQEDPTIPLAVQFIIASIGIDVLFMSSIHTPSALATALGFIGALFLGEFAVEVGLFEPETILYMAIAAIGSFSNPSYEFALVLKIFQIILIVLAAIWTLPGFLIGLAVITIYVARTSSFGVPYLWPLIPFDYQSLKALLLRQTVYNLSEERPSIYRPLDKVRFSFDTDDDKED